jgi:hypothetical protein
MAKSPIKKISSAVGTPFKEVANQVEMKCANCNAPVYIEEKLVNKNNVICCSCMLVISYENKDMITIQTDPIDTKEMESRPNWNKGDVEMATKRMQEDLNLMRKEGRLFKCILCERKMVFAPKMINTKLIEEWTIISTNTMGVVGAICGMHTMNQIRSESIRYIRALDGQLLV